jgi:glycosyltransferase involved in cell wall biosynthesis
MINSVRCSIVIRAFNEEKHIGRLLAGIMEQSVRDPEIILVDSGSTDATLAIASRYPVEIVHIQPEEFTFGRSLNRGIQSSSGEFVAIASAHVYPVYPDWLDQLLAPFEQPNVALVYGRQRGNHKTKFSEHQLFSRMFPAESNPVQNHPFCNNANAAIRRALWEEHPYDEELSGLEDIEWASCAISRGHLISYAAEAEIVHVHQETPKQVYNRYRREAMALKRIKSDESFGIVELFRLYLSNVLSDLREARRVGVLGNEWKNVAWFRWMQFYGTYRGFQQSGVLTNQLKQVFYYPKQGRAGIHEPERKLTPIDYSLVDRGEHERQ